MEGRSVLCPCAARGIRLKILYVASAVEALGASGGSTHVQEVACGLKALGHKVVVIARPTNGIRQARLACGVRLITSRYPKEVAFMARKRVEQVYRKFKPDVVMERYYNFAGAGVSLAHEEGLPILLEVNAPMFDPPGSLKSRVDRFTFGAMRSWAVSQANRSSAIVTPLASTIPNEVPRSKIHELPWGANVERFRPDLREHESTRLSALRAEIGLQSEGPVAVFLGSFRAWHGVPHFVEAARRLIENGSKLSFLAVGGGPDLDCMMEDVQDWHLPYGRLVFTGPQPHESIPDLLALADIGVAPFDLEAHAPLRTFGFYWSPLKVFEYMATGLPVITIDVHPLDTIVRHEQEGILYKSGDIDGLVGSLHRLQGDTGLAKRLGANGRMRVVAHYSWEKHCRELDRLLRSIVRG